MASQGGFIALSRDQFPGSAQVGGGDLSKRVNGVCVRFGEEKETFFYEFLLKIRALQEIGKGEMCEQIQWRAIWCHTVWLLLIYKASKRTLIKP